MTSLPVQLSQIPDALPNLHTREFYRIEWRELVTRLGEYERGERTALPTLEDFLGLIRLWKCERDRADSFRRSCDERDTLIAHLLWCNEPERVRRSES